jgi:hypothetical protein
MNKNLNIKIEDLELSIRVMNALIQNDIKTVGDLVQKTRDELIRIPNFGRKSLNEIKEVLSSMSLELGMNIDTQPEEPQPTVFDNLNREILRSTMDAFTKTYNSIMDLNKNDTVRYGDMTKAFEQHKKVLDTFEDSYRNIFN